MNNVVNPIPEDSLLGKIMAEVADRPKSAKAIASAIPGVTKKEVNGVLYACRPLFQKGGWSPLCVRGVSEHDENIKLWGIPVAAAAEEAEAEADVDADPEE